ncbi:hypothetical protein [Sandaracinobacter neustonicus]|uniref:hypothetical protein n=1 Tax=Sandaracinobacter neustonicus TaxID=1715348 RepID=UPI0015E2F65E|nr:hypothetical protein [Sandaracinobacter neustonicus]
MEPTTYEVLIAALGDEVGAFMSEFVLPGTVVLLGLMAASTAIRYIRGMFRSAT